MKRSKAGVLVSASFERTVETFVQAAIHGQHDSCGGVTESIVMNRLARIGSGTVTLLQAPEPPKEVPKFVGRRRRAKKIDDDDDASASVKVIVGGHSEASMKGSSVFQPTWRYKVDPEHLFNICVMEENRQPFTPPPQATAAWGEETNEPDFGPPPPIAVAAWGAEEAEPDMEPSDKKNYDAPATPPPMSPPCAMTTTPRGSATSTEHPETPPPLSPPPSGVIDSTNTYGDEMLDGDNISSPNPVLPPSWSVRLLSPKLASRSDMEKSYLGSYDQVAQCTSRYSSARSFLNIV